MLNSSMNDRESQCQSLDDFTEKIHQEIVETISTLNWTIESIGTDVSILEIISHQQLNEQNYFLMYSFRMIIYWFVHMTHLIKLVKRCYINTWNAVS